ncbi:phosphatidylserine/phosphatidylglycerophosphate/cardiolipin synthase-like protein [Haloferax larsenii JCM 13917]|nr:phospholipase D-like domain-containing protein [Haloferax larsenii]ELZ80503.1 phosphatidylserine/phosphatidylglycerophosphate/cardiolipin synthase-like protein [Haloferax larsenii JCM 13917]
MDEDLLASCSDEVSSALKYLSEYIANSDDEHLHTPETSAAYCALNHVNSEAVRAYAEDVRIERDRDYYLYEHSDSLVFLAKILNKYPNIDNIDIQSDLRYLKKLAESVQMSKGDFSVSAYDLSGPMWFLSQINDDSVAVKNAINRLISKFPKEELSKYSFGLNNAALGVVALSEINFQKYQKDISDILEWMSKQICDLYDRDRGINPVTTAYCLIAFIEGSEKHWPIQDKLKQQLEDQLAEEDRSKESLSTTGIVTLALIHAGDGPKIPAIQAERKIKRINEQMAQVKPRFISTVPSTRQKTRKTEILSKVQQMIEGTDSILRISTLRIDMLYDNIIDKIDSESDVEVRILTNSGSTSGSRAKLKKAAMNELVKRTDGNVKEDELVHSRFVIADDSELVVSTADLTREQLYEEYNAGIYTQDTESVDSAIDFFDDAWEEADHRGTK